MAGAFALVIYLSEMRSYVLALLRYSTGSNLNTNSALIQNFYSQETGSHQAVHIALNTGTEEGEKPGVKAYIRFVRSFRLPEHDHVC